jgi:hypothetical protein
MQILSRVALLVIAVAGVFINPAVCRADARCPWLNAATAGGFLGGDVEMNVTPLTSDGDATCEFTRKQDSTVSILNIAVHTINAPSNDFASYLSQCKGSTIPLKAIGTDAVQCLPKGNSAKREELVIARVRERVFVLTVYRKRTESSLHEEGLPKDTRNIAEQVAGRLF